MPGGPESVILRPPHCARSRTATEHPVAAQIRSRSAAVTVPLPDGRGRGPKWPTNGALDAMAERGPSLARDEPRTAGPSLDGTTPTRVSRFGEGRARLCVTTCFFVLFVCFSFSWVSLGCVCVCVCVRVCVCVCVCVFVASWQLTGNTFFLRLY